MIVIASQTKDDFAYRAASTVSRRCAFRGLVCCASLLPTQPFAHDVHCACSAQAVARKALGIAIINNHIKSDAAKQVSRSAGVGVVLSLRFDIIATSMLPKLRACLILRALPCVCACLRPGFVCSRGRAVGVRRHHHR